MKTFTVHTITGLFLAVLMLPQIAGAQEDRPVKPVKELIAELKSSTDTAKKKEYLRLLTQAEPQTKEEKEQIIDLIADDDADIKCAAMNVMGRIKEKKAVKKIISNLKNKKAKVKLTAAAVLGEIGDVRALDAMLDDADVIVLEFGHCPAARIGAPALPKLVDVAERIDILGVLNPKQGKKSIKSRKAAYCIGQIRDEKAVPALIKLLKEDDESVKLAAVEALAAMNIKEAESEFEKMLNIEQKALTPKEMRKIMDTETKDMKSKILSHLVAGNKGKFVPKVLGILTEAANQEYFKWQETLGVGFSANDFTTKSGFDIYAAVNLAGILNEKKAIPALEKILKHEEGTIRHAAAVALWKITGKVYKYNKSLHVQGEDEYWIKRIKDEYDRFKAKKADFNKQRASGRMSEEIYRFYMDHETEELLKKHTLERLRKEAQEQGYLLEYNSVDEILEEIKKNPEKYEWR